MWPGGRFCAACRPLDPVLFSGTIRYAGLGEGTGGGRGRGKLTPRVNCDLQCHNLGEAQYGARPFTGSERWTPAFLCQPTRLSTESPPPPLCTCLQEQP